MTKLKTQVVAKVIKAPVSKESLATLSLSSLASLGTGEWKEPTVDQRGLKSMVDHSTILPQCIASYKNNIAGFGIGIRYKEDVEETAEMISEYEKAEAILSLLNVERDLKTLFEDLIEERETYGIAYLEVIRNALGEVVEVELIKDTTSLRKGAVGKETIETIYYHKGIALERKKKFSKYKQEINSKTVYFKEFGDPRIMERSTGEYVAELNIEKRANEILEFKIGTSTYGTVRWIGQALNVDGSRRAESLNNNYFENGRHTPLAVILNGGTLSEDSYTKLQEYMNGIKGEAGQHSFLLLEVEDTGGKTDFEGQKGPTVELKDMASILQKDELFQDYLDNSRKKVQSAFRLPDLYTGYTTDFNRATSQTAQEVTEQQVFVPERHNLAWVINNKLLNDYAFKYIEVYFKAPDVTNPEDIARLLNVSERAGGLTPNMAKELTFKAMGGNAEPYDRDWGDTPLALLKIPGAIMQQIDSTIEKAQKSKDEDIVAVLRSLKKQLRSEENVY